MIDPSFLEELEELVEDMYEHLSTIMITNYYNYVQEALREIQHVMADARVMQIKQAVLELALNNSEDDLKKIRQQLSWKIYPSIVPDLSQYHKNPEIKTLIHYLVNYNQKVEEIEQLDDEYGWLCHEMSDAFNFFNNHDFKKRRVLPDYLERQYREYYKSLANYYGTSIKAVEKAKELNQISISLEEALELYHQQPDYYQLMLFNSMDPKKREPDQLLEILHQTYLNFANRHLTILPSMIQIMILSQWELVCEEQIQQEIENVTLAALHGIYPTKIPLKFLYNFGEENLYEFINHNQNWLKQHPYIEPEEFDDIKKTITEFIDNFTNKFYPRLDADQLTNNQMILLQGVDMLDRIPAKRQENIKPLDDLVFKSFQLIENRHDLCANDYQYLQLDPADQAKVDQMDQELLDNFDHLFELEETLNCQRIPQRKRYAIWEDFQANSAKFYAILDQVTGQSQQTSDLPLYIVEEVEKYKVDTQNLEVNLRPYQLFGSQYALHFKKTLLGDEMGLGKTIQALAMINHLANQGKKHAIVICPLSILTNWTHEIKRWTHLTPYLFRGRHAKKNLLNWQKDGGILLLNYERVKQLIEIPGDYDQACLILDEAHMIKNPNAQRSINTEFLINEVEYVLLMTGTPMENNLGEMKRLVSLVNPILGAQLNAREQTADHFKSLITTAYLRRKRDDVLKELPDIELVEMWSTFTPEEEEYYLDSIPLEGISGVMKMRRAAFVGGNPKKSGKIQQIISLCQEAKDNGDKIIIFSFFKSVLETVQDFVAKDCVGILSGDVPADARQGLIDAFFQADDGAVLLSQIDAGGMGLNIQAANIVILCEPQWKPSTESQAVGRVYRMGQNKNVVVYRLLTEESIDESLMTVLGYKADLFNTYAHDSLVSDAFEQKEREKELSETMVKQEVLKLERERLENARGIQPVEKSEEGKNRD